MEPPSHVASQSPGTTRYWKSTTESYFCPLSLTGEVRFTGRSISHPKASAAISYIATDDRHRIHRDSDRAISRFAVIAKLCYPICRKSWRSMPLPDERLVFLDLEPGGAEPWRPIMQVAAIAVDSGLRELEAIEAKLRFDMRLVHPACRRKKHYSAEVWDREAISEQAAGERFAAFLRRHATVDMISADRCGYRVAQLVAHNAAFDAPFLACWFERIGRFLPAHPRVLCTHQRLLWLFHEHKSLTPPADYQLGTLCQYFGVRLKNHEAHEALADVRATVALYRAMTLASCHQRRLSAAI